MVRVRLVEADAKASPEPGAAPAAPRWQLDQLPQAQAALVSLDPNDGAVRALVGGFSYAGNMYNRVTQARRQHRPSLKPFLYAAALARGLSSAERRVGEECVRRCTCRGEACPSKTNTEQPSNKRH